MPRMIALAVLFSSAAAWGQPNLAGTWRLDESRSSIAADATLAGLIGAGAPETLHVTQPRNGTLVVESQVNESHARLYMPGKKTSTPIFVGEAGTITMTSRWDGAKLVSEGTRESSADTSASSTPVTEAFGLSDDGETLEVEITVSRDGATSASSLRYTRITDVGPCDSWPSPCKDPARPDR